MSKNWMEDKTINITNQEVIPEKIEGAVMRVLKTKRFSLIKLGPK